MIKSLTLAWKWASPRLTDGSSSDTCFGDGLHLFRLPGESSHSCCGDDPHLVGLLGHLLDRLKQSVADGHAWETFLSTVRVR